MGKFTLDKIVLIIIIVVFAATALIYTFYHMRVSDDEFFKAGLVETYRFSIDRYKKGSGETELYKHIVIYINEKEETLEVTQPEKPYRKERELNEKEVKLFQAFIKKNKIDGLPSYPRTPGGFEYLYYHGKIGHNRVTFYTASEKRNAGYVLLINKFLELAKTGDFKTVNIKWKDILAGK